MSAKYQDKLKFKLYIFYITILANDRALKVKIPSVSNSNYVTTLHKYKPIDCMLLVTDQLLF